MTTSTKTPSDETSEDTTATALEFDLDPVEDVEAPLVIDEDSPNLVLDLEGSKEGEKVLQEICEHARTTFDQDWESNEKWRDKQAQDFKLFSGDLPPKDFPFEKCANMHVPLMLENIVRIYFRSFDELYGDWTDIFKVLPVNPDDQMIADTLSKHGNWQLREQLTDFYRQEMRSMLRFFAAGDTVRHSFYDNQARRNRHETLTPDDFVVPYSHVTTEPNYSDVPHRTKVLYKYRFQLQAMRETWANVDEVIDREPAAWDDEPSAEFREEQARTQGIEPPTDTKSAPYKLLHWEGWTDALPDQERDRFIQLIMDYRTGRPLSLVIHEEVDWQDRLRFEAQAAELTQYRQACVQHELDKSEMLQQQGKVLMNADAASVAPDPAEVQGLLQRFDPEQIPKPVTPGWCGPEHYDEDGNLLPDAEPEQPRKVPIHTFVHGVCIEPLAGNVGLGFGKIVADLNRAANTALSQFTDSASLANGGGFMLGPHMELERPMEWGPAKVNKIKTMNGSISDNIYELKRNPANPQLLDTVKFAEGLAQRVAQAPDVLSGQAGKSGETFRGQQLRVEQATKQLTVPTRTYAITVLTPILKNNALLNSVFLPDEEIVNVNLPQFGQVQQLRISRKMYERDYRTQIVGDLQFSSQAQKVAAADEILGMAGSLPPLQANPAFIYTAIKTSLEARKRFDLIALLGPPPPPPQFPMGMAPPSPGAPPGPPAPPPGGPRG